MFRICGLPMDLPFSNVMIDWCLSFGVVWVTFSFLSCSVNSRLDKQGMSWTHVSKPDVSGFSKFWRRADGRIQNTKSIHTALTVLVTPKPPLILIGVQFVMPFPTFPSDLKMDCLDGNFLTHSCFVFLFSGLCFAPSSYFVSFFVSLWL